MERYSHPQDAVKMGRAAQMQMDASPRIAELSLSDMVGVMARLAQVMAEEVDHLDAMRIREIEGLQDEKRKLSKMLFMMKKEIERHPEISQNFSGEDVASFHEVAQIFDNILQENHRKLLVAKEINYRVVQAISDVVEEETLRPGYNRQGTKSRTREGAPSVSLNKTI